MKRIVNKAAIDKKAYNSTYVGVLSYHAIQIKEEGSYLGHIIYKGKVLDTVKIDCRDSCGELQANLDLYSFGTLPGSQRGVANVPIQPEGYLLLFNSRGDTPYRFQLEKVGERPYGNILRDTKELCPGDLYACTIIRPGTYQVLFNGKQTATVCVAYPNADADKNRLTEAVRVSLGGKEQKKTIDLLPMQGLVFEFGSSGCVEVIQTEEVKDRGLIYQNIKRQKKTKSPGEKKTYQWRNPKYTKTK